MGRWVTVAVLAAAGCGMLAQAPAGRPAFDAFEVATEAHAVQLDLLIADLADPVTEEGVLFREVDNHKCLIWANVHKIFLLLGRMVYKVIGLMSGSSLDGLDIAYVHLQERAGSSQQAPRGWDFQLVHT